MEHVVYILFSPHSGRSYAGSTSDLINRMRSHNFLAKKGFTIRHRPWVVIHLEFFDSKSDALKRELFYKTGVGRESIRDIIQKFK